MANADMPDEHDIGISKEILNTVINLIENGDVNNLTEQEIKNFFMMSQQIEIYDEKFRAKGFYLIFEPNKGAYLTDSPNHLMIYDLGLLADRLLDKFCRPLQSNRMLSPAVKIYIETYGTSRFTRFLQASTASRQAFDLATMLGRACDIGYDIEGPLFMDCLETVALGPRGMPRVKDIIHEYVLQDESAKTLVGMMATENKEARFISEIKHTILVELEKKFSSLPKSRMWLLMTSSMNLIHAANNFPPFTDFLLKLVRSLSESITLDKETDTHYSPPGDLTYRNLVHIMSKFYRNQKTRQSIVNFVWDQFSSNPDVWGRVLKACHDHPKEDTTSETFYDSLYGKEFTDPNMSRESLQLILRGIRVTIRSQVAAASRFTPSTSNAVVKKEQLPVLEPMDPSRLYDCVAAEDLNNVPGLIESVSSVVNLTCLKQEFAGVGVVPCGQVAPSLQTPSKMAVVKFRRPLSSRARRCPKRMDDFWA